MASPRSLQHGLTLIEIVVGLVVLAIAIIGFSSALLPQAQRSVDPVYEARATELGQSLLNEIMYLDFDEANLQGAGDTFCNVGAQQRQCSTILGPEELQRNRWNDVDDYDGFTAAGELLTGDVISDLYIDYDVSVTVCYTPTVGGVCVPDTQIEEYKKIQVDVTTPNGQVITFAVFRGNI